MTIKYNYDKDGLIHFVERHSEDSQTNGFIRDPERVQELLDSGVEIAPYVEPVKTADQLKAEVVQELKSLDASPRTLANALLGDQWDIDELKRLEAEKVVLRDKLKSL
jgi:hypothetical protein